MINKLSNGNAINAFSVMLNPFVFFIKCFKENIIPIKKGITNIINPIHIPTVVPNKAIIEDDLIRIKKITIK